MNKYMIFTQNGTLKHKLQSIKIVLFFGQYENVFFMFCAKKHFSGYEERNPLGKMSKCSRACLNACSECYLHN